MKKKIATKFKPKKLNSAQLAIAWVQIQAKREKSLKETRKLVEALEKQIDATITIEIDQSDDYFVPRHILAILPKWPNMESVNKFLTKLKPLNFPITNRNGKNEIKSGYIYLTKNKGYFIYLKEPRTFDAVGC